MPDVDCATPMFSLPEVIKPLVAARNALKAHYNNPNLTFTLDGNLVGDIGEAIAVELFGLVLGSRCGEGIDGMVGSASVQVKATGTGRGPSFRKVETEADHLLFFSLDLERGFGVVEFNGPEALVRPLLPLVWEGQRAITMSQIRRANLEVPRGHRLPMRRLSGL